MGGAEASNGRFARPSTPVTQKSADIDADIRDVTALSGIAAGALAALEDAVSVLREQLERSEAGKEAERERADRAEQGRDAERARADARAPIWHRSGRRSIDPRPRRGRRTPRWRRSGGPTTSGWPRAVWRGSGGVARRVTIPARIGPVEFGTLGAMVAVRCPHEFDSLMRRAGDTWEPGSRRWLIERRRIGPVIRELRRTTDPLFRRAGLDLDEG